MNCVGDPMSYELMGFDSRNQVGINDKYNPTHSLDISDEFPVI